MKTRFIVNPASGRARAALGAVRTFASAHLADIVFTARPRHATELARHALDEGCQLVVAVGGDGTMHEIATALVDSPATLGLVPCGSGDGLALSLGIPRTISRALQILLTGQSRSIDSALVDDRPFFNAVGFGFEAEVAHRFAGLAHRGLAGYARAGLTPFLARSGEPITVHHDRGRAALTIWSLAIQNSEQLGNGLVSAPGARLDDGKFDLVATAPAGLFQKLVLVARLATGAFGLAEGVTWLRSTHFVLERRAPGRLHLDGEPSEAGARLEIAVRPRSLRVMAPVPPEPALIEVTPAGLAEA